MCTIILSNMQTSSDLASCPLSVIFLAQDPIQEPALSCSLEIVHLQLLLVLPGLA